MSKTGRPPTYTDDTIVRIRSGPARTRLQRHSERRAILDDVIDHRGRVTLGELDEDFGYSVRKQVIALTRAEWLEIVE